MSTASNESPLITCLRNPEAYPHATGKIVLVETHISWILLTGEFAYKIKKTVDFGFLDFSTLARRRFFCKEEVRLNSRFSDSLYLGVVPITGSLAHPEVGGHGQAIEYAVKMRQFEAGCLLSERAGKGLLTIIEIDQLAELIGQFHLKAPIAEQISPYGEAGDIRHWSEENFDHIEPRLDDVVQRQRMHKLKEWTREEWQKQAPIMRQRKKQGFVRQCHGDLHLGNIALIDGRVTPFDCIEFNPLLSWIDVISEMAFILMDLAQRKFYPLFWRLLNGYLHQTGDYAGLALLRYYMVYRALVRVKVALLSCHPNADADELERIHNDYSSHTKLAEHCIKATHPMLFITHGYSGSGKSHFSRQLVENPGAIHLRSDIERKRLYGFDAKADTASSLGEGIYTEQASRRTYCHLAEQAESALNAGYDVIVDATFLKSWQREIFHQLAEKLNLPLMILDFKATDAVLTQRIQARQQRRHDPSEATVEVMHQQIAKAEPLTEDEQKQAIEVDTEQPDAMQRVLSVINDMHQ